MKYPKPESNQLEFKQAVPKNDQIIKTMIGFCNQQGGELIIGVADDGTVLGIPDGQVESTIESVEKSIYDACYPPILPMIASQQFDDKHVIVIQVSTGMNKPYYRRSEGKENSTYIRLGKHTLKATPDIIRELEWQGRGLDFERLPAYDTTEEDIDFKKFQMFLDNRKNMAKTDINEETLKAYRVISHEHSRTYPSILGILLFGRNPQNVLTEAFIICSHFKGNSGRDTIATVDCNGTLFDQFKQAYDFVLSRLSKSFKIESLEREETLEIPETAIREAILNMVIHRNYHIKAPSKIAIYEDRIELHSPGQFPGPLKTSNLLRGISYLRNPMICKIMRERGYIEKLGSGFLEIFNSYAKRKLHRPVVIEGENFIKCILPRVAETETDDFSNILQLFAMHADISISDVTKQLSLSRSTALRRLNEMINQDLIERSGEKRYVRYRKV